MGHFLQETGVSGLENWNQPSGQARQRPSDVNSSPATHFLIVVFIKTGPSAKVMGLPNVGTPEKPRFKVGEDPGSALNSTPLNW